MTNEKVAQKQVIDCVTKLRYLEHIFLCQAEDYGLWCIAETATESYLQEHLRNLHAAIEAEHLDDIKKILWMNYLEKK